MHVNKTMEPVGKRSSRQSSPINFKLFSVTSFPHCRRVRHQLSRCPVVVLHQQLWVRLPFFDTTHGTDLVQVFFGLLPDYAQSNIRKYYANFVYNLDPNNASGGNGKGSSAVPNDCPSGRAEAASTTTFTSHSSGRSRTTSARSRTR